MNQRLMSDASIIAIIDAMQAAPGHTYRIELSYTDFSNLMWALQTVWHDGRDAHSDVVRGFAAWAAALTRQIASNVGADPT